MQAPGPDVPQEDVNARLAHLAEAPRGGVARTPFDRRIAGRHLRENGAVFGVPRVHDVGVTAENGPTRPRDGGAWPRLRAMRDVQIAADDDPLRPPPGRGGRPAAGPLRRALAGLRRLARGGRRS